MVIQVLKKNPDYRSDKDLQILAPLLKKIEFFREKDI